MDGQDNNSSRPTETPRLATRSSSDSLDRFLVSDEPVLLPGTRYQLEGILGDGGAGRVYRATHLELDKQVAVKVLHTEVSSNPTYAARFRREARAASRIQHSGVVDVTDFGVTDDGRLFLVMEMIEGQTLAQLVQHGPPELDRALRIAANLCDILEVIHQAGVLHRDIKPANVFILADDQVKIVDFGIAKVGALVGDDWKITRTGKVVGTPGYMAPEHARGSTDLDNRADLYSFGALLYEMLTGVQPFQGDNPVEVLMAQISGKITRPSAVLEGLPSGVDRLVLRLLAVKREARYGSAADVARLLRRIVEQRASTVEVDDASKEESSSHGWIVATLLASAIIIVAGFAVGFWLVTRSIPSTPPADEPVTAVREETPSSPPDEPEPASIQPVVVESPRDVADAAPEATPLPPPRVDRPEPLVARREVSSPRTATTSPSPPPSSSRREPSSGAAPGALLRQARIAAASGRPSEAERLFEQARAAGADRATVLSGLGRIALARGQHVRAVRLFEQVVGGGGGSPRVRLDLGRAYAGAGQTQRAIGVWRSVLRADPDNARARRLIESAGATP